MDKYQATVAVKQAALVWIVTSTVMLAHTVAKGAGYYGAADTLYVVACGTGAATAGVLLMHTLDKGFPTFHLDDDKPPL